MVIKLDADEKKLVEAAQSGDAAFIRGYLKSHPEKVSDRDLPLVFAPEGCLNLLDIAFLAGQKKGEGKNADAILELIVNGKLILSHDVATQHFKLDYTTIPEEARGLLHTLELLALAAANFKPVPAIGIFRGRSDNAKAASFLTFLGSSNASYMSREIKQAIAGISVADYLNPYFVELVRRGEVKTYANDLARYPNIAKVSHGAALRMQLASSDFLPTIETLLAKASEPLSETLITQHTR